jgi:predicted transcriptional regulator
LSEVVTVKLAPNQMAKLDRLSMDLGRSRAGTIRRLISGAVATGRADLRAEIERGVDDADNG